MRCAHCDTRLGGLLGAFRARAVSCPDESCGAQVCIDCMTELAETRESGFGPFRRGVLEVRCPRCSAMLHRTEFPSELQQAARSAVGAGRKKVRELLLKAGLESLQRQGRRG